MSKAARVLASLALAGLAFALPSFAKAATITIVNGDPPNVGFNDTTAIVPVGRNNGTTLGQQRLNVYQAVAIKWGAKLSSAVPILVFATWEPLACDETSAVLGSAGAVFVYSDFPNAPFPDTWYSSALANKLAEVYLIPPDPDAPYIFTRLGVDIRARFNVNLGSPTCLPGAAATPAGAANRHGSSGWACQRAEAALRSLTGELLVDEGARRRAPRRFVHRT